MRALPPLALAGALIAGPALALEPISPPDAPILVFTTDKDYDSVKTDLELAITGRGMIVTNTLHISEMYARTSKDLGLEKTLYKKAESLEFCSIKMSYDMSLAHPGNLAICPLTIGLYLPEGGPDKVHLVFRRPVLLGDGAAAAKALTEMLQGIVDEAAE